MSISEDNNYDELSTFEIFIEKFTRGVYGLLHVMSKSTSDTILSCNIGFFIDFMQVLSFHFPLPKTREIHDQFGWYPYFTDWLAYLSNAFRVYPYIKLNQTLLTVVFILSLISVTIMVVNAVFVWYLFSQNTFKMLWTVILLRMTASIFNYLIFVYILAIMFGPLYIPCLSLLATQLQCENESNEGFVCWGAVHSIVVAIAVIFGLMLIIIALIFQATYFNRDPTSGSYLSRPHSRVQAWQLLIKTFLSLFFTVLNEDSDTFWFLIFLLIFGNFTTAYSYTIYSPYFYWKFNETRAAAYWVLTWTSICVALNYAWHSSVQHNVTIMYFILIPFVIFSAIVTMKMRKQFLLHCKVKDLSNVFEFELKSRFMLEDVTSYMRSKNEDFGFYAYHDEKSPPHPGGYSYMSLPSFPKSEDEHDLIRLRHENLLDDAEVVYEHGLRRFPVALMFLFKAQHGFCYNTDVSISQQALDDAEDRQPWFDESFSIYSLRLAHEQTSESNQHDIISFISSQKYHEDATREDENSTRFQLEFWSELLNTKPDLAVLHDMSAKINDAMNNAQDAYNKLIKLNPMSAHFLRLYASFKIDLQNQPEKAVTMLKRADDIEEANLRANRDGGNANSLDDRSAVISVSGVRERMGEIIDINTGIMRLFGYSRSELMGANVSRLMPAPYSFNHTALMNHTLPTVGNYMNRSNIVFGLHKNGYLIPLELFLRQVSNISSASTSWKNNDASFGKNTSYIAVIKYAQINPSALQLGPIANVEIGIDISKKENATNLSANFINTELKFEFCFIDAQSFVTYASFGCLSIFETTSDLLRAGSILITSWIQDFDAKKSRICSNKGEEINLLLTSGISIKAQCIGQNILVGPDSYIMLQFNISSKALASTRHSASVVKNDTGSNRLKGDNGSLKRDNTSIGSRRSFRDSVSLNDTSSLNGSMNRKKRRASHIAQIEKTKNRISSKNYALLLSSGNTADSSLQARLSSFSKSSENSDLTFGLKILQFILFWTLAIVCAAAIAEFSVINYLMSLYSGKLNHLNAMSNIRFLSARISYNTFILTQSSTSDSFATGKFFSYAQFNDSLKLITSDSKTIALLCDSIFLNPSIPFGNDAYNLYQYPRIPLYSIHDVNGNITYPLTNYRIWDALELYISKARAVVDLSPSLIKDTEASTFFILRNGQGDLFTFLNSTCNYFEISVKDSIFLFRTWAIALVVCSILLVLIVLLFAVRPTIWLIEENKLSVLMLFTEIPQPIIHLFKDRCIERLDRMMGNLEDAAVPKTDNNNDSAALNVEYKSIEREVTGMDNTGTRYLSLLKISISLVVCVIFFASTYFYIFTLSSLYSYWSEFGIIESKMKTSPSNLNWAYYRDVSFLNIVSGLTRLLLQNYTLNYREGSSGIIPITVLQINNEITLYHDLVSALQYGDLNRFNIDVPNSDQTYLLTSAKFCNLYPNSFPKNCISFFSGELNKGFSSVLLSSYNLMVTSLINIPTLNLTDYNRLNLTLNGANLQTLIILEKDYMTVLSSLSNSIYYGLISSLFDPTFNSRVAGLIIFIFSIIIIFIFYYNPLIWYLNSEQKRTTLLLLIIPSSIMEKMLSLRIFVEKHAQEWEE